MIEVVSVLIAAGDREHAGTQDVGNAMDHQQRVARIGDQLGQTLGNAQAPLGSRQQHHATVGGDAPTIEGCGEFLASNGWKTEGLNRIVLHGGCGSA